MRKRNTNQFPNFAINLDKKLMTYRTVYVLGDLHDHEHLFRTFLIEKGIAFVPNVGGDLNSLENYFLKSDVLLIFLGDVLYKTKGHFKRQSKFCHSATF